MFDGLNVPILPRLDSEWDVDRCNQSDSIEREALLVLAVFSDTARGRVMYLGNGVRPPYIITIGDFSVER